VPYDDNPTITPLVDAMIIATALGRAWESITTDPDISKSARLDTLANRIIGLQEDISALRVIAARHLVEFTDPAAVERRAADNAAERAAHARKQAAHTKRIERAIDERLLREAVEKAQDDLHEAKAVATAMEKAEASGTDRVLGKGAVAAAEQALRQAEARLAAHLRGPSGRRP